jgi:hypothetical protein
MSGLASHFRKAAGITKPFFSRIHLFALMSGLVLWNAAIPSAQQSVGLGNWKSKSGLPRERRTPDFW